MFMVVICNLILHLHLYRVNKINARIHYKTNNDWAVMNNEKLNYLTESEEKYLFNLANNRMSIGDFINALACYQYLVLTNNDKPIYTKALASCFQRQNKYNLAYFYYQLSYSNNPRDIDCNFYSAVCLFNMGLYDKAVEIFNSYKSVSENLILISRCDDYLQYINQKDIANEA